MCCVCYCCFCRIVSFGAPSTNEYRLVVEGQAPISLQTSMVRLLLLSTYFLGFQSRNLLSSCRNTSFFCNQSVLSVSAVLLLFPSCVSPGCRNRQAHDSLHSPSSQVLGCVLLMTLFFMNLYHHFIRTVICTSKTNVYYLHELLLLFFESFHHRIIFLDLDVQ